MTVCKKYSIIKDLDQYNLCILALHGDKNKTNITRKNHKKEREDFLPVLYFKVLCRYGMVTRKYIHLPPTLTTIEHGAWLHYTTFLSTVGPRYYCVGVLLYQCMVVLIGDCDLNRRLLMLL